ncbi:MAG: prolyl oligopeptidase family serine peptidase [Myxococcota bacterium]
MLLSLLLSTSAVATEWQSPPQEVLDVLHAPSLPWVWSSPPGDHLLLADPVTYPPLSEYAAGWHELAGIRVKPGLGLRHGRQGATSPRLVEVNTGAEQALDLPDGAEVHSVAWTVDGTQFALTVEHADHVRLWVGDVTGTLKEIPDLVLNPTMGGAVSWMPDQERLLILSVPERGAEPAPPPIPAGPEVLEGRGDTARSTYESRNLLVTAHDDALFDYYATSQLIVLDPRKDKRTALGDPAVFATAEPSPDGKYVLVERLVGPWSHAVPWWRFASEIEVWNKRGKRIATVASLPVADEVPIQGVAEGPRAVSWRATAPHTLYWVEALDGGDPMAEARYRDRLMRLEAPFKRNPRQVWKAKHRIISSGGWTEDGSTLMITERERMRRWRYTHLLNVDTGKARAWFDLNEKDRYQSPGRPRYRPLDNGQWVLRQKGNAVYFSGAGATAQGDRPFLDLRDMKTGKVERLFRADAERFETFTAFAGGEDRFIIRSESPTEVPNYHLATLTERIEAEAGEASWAQERTPVTRFTDPTPQLRQIQKRIVKYEREDGVPLSFQLYLPPGYQEGEKLPTVVYAYPLEYSDPSTAGQVRGSSNRFERMGGASHMFFLLQGYAVLHRTAMPMVGDPETVYDTFVDQLVADAEAAVAKAIEIGVADPERIGVVGHSHGGLMVANLLAHTDLFKAGIARSGSYNKTTQPFGFQSERRTLFEARDTYIQVSPTFFADQVDEPVLVIHGGADSNPGTLTFQSEVFFEAVRGSGGTARLVLLPFEDHGYRARESIEHVLWEQLRWFDEHVKGSSDQASASR